MSQTVHRIKILEYLNSVYSHPTADTIYSQVKNNLPTITLATVYRNLNLLSKEGRINKLNINGQNYFDAHCDGHIHTVCTMCNKINDINYDINFPVKNVESVLIFTKCGDCSAKIINKKKDLQKVG